jgi:hypothetical protein
MARSPYHRTYNVLKILPKDAQWALMDINLTDDGLTIAQVIRGNSAVGTLADNATTSLRINCSRFPTWTFQMTYDGLLSPKAGN